MAAKRIRLTPGDIFAVPLGGGRHALGRLAPQRGCALFAAVTFTDLRMPDEWAKLPMITLEDLILTEAIEFGRWPIIGNVPWNPGEFEWQHYMVGSQVTCAEGPLTKFTEVSSKTRPAERAEWHWRPKLGISNEEGVIQILRRKLSVA